jgi:hypothetical protein
VARQLEDRSDELKEIKALLKRRELTERVREVSTLLRITIVGRMDTMWQIATQSRAVTIPIMGSNVNPIRQTTWEEVNPTRNYM